MIFRKLLFNRMKLTDLIISQGENIKKMVRNLLKKFNISLM